MKSVLISVRPKWCEKICHEIVKDANGEPIYEKVIEVRKSKPNEVPCRVFIYQSKESKKRYINDRFLSLFNGKTSCSDMGKVIGEFICDKVYKWEYDYCDGVDIDDDLIVDTRLDREDINIYAKGKTLYGWHISDLKIYDKPRELSEFLHWKKYDWWDYGCNTNKPQYEWKSIERPPQSWCYVEEEK